jgi:hypoxanthine phosphoribosyltransferase
MTIKKKRHKTHAQRKKELAKKGVLPGELLNRLRELFEYKRWNVDFAEISCYMRYVRTMSKLKPEEQNLLFDLSRRFEHIQIGDYAKALAKPLGQLRDQYAGKLIFIGCVTEDDIKNHEVKSCMNVLYQLKGTTMKYYIEMGRKRVCDNARYIRGTEIDEVNAGNAMLVFVDDFIGTGETAVEAARYLAKAQPKLTNWKNVCYLAIAAQKEGVKRLRDSGYSVYVTEEYGKGISDYYKGKQLAEARATMLQIESGLKKLEKDFRFGYQQSEALLSMERCPNNTFPIYWLTKHDAPYER